MSQPRTALEPDAPPAFALAGVVVLLVVLCLRVLVSYDPTPGWGGNPLELESPIVGLTPVGSLIIDGVTLGASGLILVAMAKRGKVPPAWQTLCLAAGGVAIALHGRVLIDASVSNLVIGCSWFAAFAGAFAATQAARSAQLRRLIVAATLGLIAPLVVKGAVQYFVEQPDSLREFLEHKERYLGANGWTTGSSMALAYLRRLEQPEATGWFGMANVFATLAAASLATLTEFCGSSRLRQTRTARRWMRGACGRCGYDMRGLARCPECGEISLGRPDRPEVVRDVQTLGFLIVGVVASGAGVYLAGSKGGYAASALGLGLVGFVFVMDRRASVGVVAPSGWRSLPLAVGSAAAVVFPLLALVAVTLRGLVGTRMHELSLLFRWFYIETAARIFAAHPLLGTGPEGFKDAYMLLKPAISPEDISSPHSIFFDMAARLGLGGVALSALLIGWLWGTGRGLIPTREEAASSASRAGGQATSGTSGTSTRAEARILLVIIAVATAVAAILEQPAATVTSSLVRAGGIAGFMMIGLAVLRVMSDESSLRRFLNPAIAIGAIAGFTHTQIELTGITPGANLWLFVLLAMGLGAHPRAVAATSSALARVRAAFAPVLVVAAFGLMVPFAILPIARWDLLLREASGQVQDVPSFTLRAEAVARNMPFPGDTAKALAADLSASLGLAVEPRTIPSAVSELRYQRATSALTVIQKTSSIRPTDSETVHAMARLMLEVAAMDESRGRPSDARAGADRAEKLALDYCNSDPTRPAQLAWLGMVRRSRYELDRNPVHLSDAVDAWVEAAALAPHEPLYVAQLARANALLSRREEAAKWAQRALEINQELYLDPLRQFNTADLAELTALAKPAATPSAHPSSPP